jgi:hypothetical protein
MESLLIDDYGPATVMEEILLGRFASIQWKLERLMSAEQDLGMRQRYKRMDSYQQQLHMSELSPLCPKPIDKPHEVSSGWEIFADDFQSNGKQGRLQQMTQLEIRLTGQMLAISRQLVQMRKLRIAEAKAGLKANAECGVRNAECQTEAVDDAMAAARNEPIRIVEETEVPEAAHGVIPSSGTPGEGQGGGSEKRRHLQEPPPQPARGQSLFPLASPGVPEEGEKASLLSNAPARNEAIRDLANRAGIDVPPLTPALSPEYGGEGVISPALSTMAARNEPIRNIKTCPSE